MQPHPGTSRAAFQLSTRCAAVGLALVFVSSLQAQVAAPPRVDAVTLARFDQNRNGVLDPDELRAMEAEMKSAASSDVSAEEPIALSPFEVVADTRGYFAANTMSGTRLNTKLEDLASSITVMTREQRAQIRF